MNRKKSLISGLIILGYILLIAGITSWFFFKDEYQIRSHLINITFYFLEINFAFIIIGFLININFFKKLWIDIPVKIRYISIIISILGIILTAFVAPRTHRIFYDEEIYENIGQNLACLQKAQICSEGSNDFGEYKCFRGEYNKQPYGYPHLISIVYRIFGVSEGITYALNNIIFGLSIILIFFIGFLIFQNYLVGLWASLLYALIPQNILWFNTTASEPSTAFTAIMTIFITISFIKFQTNKLLFLLAPVLAFSMQFRPESILVFPIVFIVFLVFNRKIFTEQKFYAMILFVLFLSINLIGHIYAVRIESWGSSGTKLSLEYFSINVIVNTLFYFKNIRFPALFSLFFLIGLITKKNIKEKAFIFIWFLAFWGIFLFFYAGSYNYGADVRYSLLSYAPIALIGGYGIQFLKNFIVKFSDDRLAYSILTLLIIISFLPFMPLIRAEGEEAWAARADHNYAREFAKLLPENSIVLTHNPNMFLVWGKNAAQVSLATTEEKYINDVLFPRYTGGVYFHWNYWCNVQDPLQVSFGENILKKYEYQLIKEYHLRDFRYALYKLKIPCEGINEQKL